MNPFLKTNFWFLLSFFTLIFQSSLLLSLFAFSIFVSDTIRVKNNRLNLFSFHFSFQFYFLFIFLFLDLELGVSVISHMTVTCYISQNNVEGSRIIISYYMLMVYSICIYIL